MHQYAGERGFATDWHLMNAGRYAAGGAGLFIVESTKVERRGCGTVGDLGLWDDAFIPGLRRIAEFTRACGAKVGIQLGHSGRKSRTGRPWEGGRPLTPETANVPDWDRWELVAPSAIAPRCPHARAARAQPPRDRRRGAGLRPRHRPCRTGRLRRGGTARRPRLPDPPVPEPAIQPAQRTTTAAAPPTACALRWRWPKPPAPPGRRTSRCSCGCRWTTAPAGIRPPAWRWPGS